MRARSFSWERKLPTNFSYTINRRKENEMKAIWGFLRDERGTETAEWALVLAVIVLVAIATALPLGQAIAAKFTEAEGAVEGAAPAGG